MMKKHFCVVSATQKEAVCCILFGLVLQSSSSIHLGVTGQYYPPSFVLSSNILFFRFMLFLGLAVLFNCHRIV